MRTVDFRLLSIAAITVLALAGSMAAQEKSGSLNSLEVQQLAKRAQPADHARLATHFTALADRYAAEAQRHTSMAQSYVGNPSRNLATGMSGHCKQLAQLNTQSATTLRELATYHRGLATGVASAPPATGSRFESGGGAPRPTDQELRALAAKADTPADHHALEEYFVTLAKRDTAEASEHVALAQAYRGTKVAQAAAHHDRLAALARDAAKAATAAADMHKQLAGLPR
jgi:hypothetical protein